MKQPKKGRLWLNDGSCIRLRPQYCGHVWSYDFEHHRTDDGKAFRTLNTLDEHSRECLAVRMKRKLNSTEVIDTLTDLFILRGVAPQLSGWSAWQATPSCLPLPRSRPSGSTCLERRGKSCARPALYWERNARLRQKARRRF